MRPQSSSAWIGMLAAGYLLMGSTPAQAFSFTTNFTGSDQNGNGFDSTNVQAGQALDPTRDIFLESVEIDGVIRSDFVRVTGAKIINNDAHNGGNTGAGSADRGDNVSTSYVKKENLAPYVDASNLGDSDIVSDVMTNTNLNHIIDTEDTGNFEFYLTFDRIVDKVLVWERGKNSDLTLQALSETGNLIGNAVDLFREDWNDAGYSIDTTEIGRAQIVGSSGISLADFGLSAPISGIRVTSRSSYNGPDWKVIGLADPSTQNKEDVPEPFALAGLGVVAGAIALKRRQGATS